MKLKWDTILALICIASFTYLLGFGGIAKILEGGTAGAISQAVFFVGWLAFCVLFFYRGFTRFK